MDSRPVRKVRIGFPFLIAAILIMIFALGVTWWAAILVGFLASMEVTLEYR